MAGEFASVNKRSDEAADLARRAPNLSGNGVH
jgi:hypothetical protein